MISGIIGPVRDILFKSGLIDTIGKDQIFTEVKKAVFYIENLSPDNSDVDNEIAVQTNKRS